MLIVGCTSSSAPPSAETKTISPAPVAAAVARDAAAEAAEPEAPACILRSANSIDSPKAEFRVDGLLVASQVAGDIEVAIAENEPTAAIKAARYGIEVAGTVAKTDVVLHSDETHLFGGVLRPLEQRLDKVVGSLLHTTFTLPTEVALIDPDTPLVMSVPCASSHYGRLDRDLVYRRTGDHGLVTSKRSIKVHATAGGPPVLIVTFEHFRRLEVFAREGARAKIFSSVGGVPLEPAAQIIGWVETSNFYEPPKIGRRDPDDIAISGVLGRNSNAPRPVESVYRCREDRRLFATNGSKSVLVGTLRSGTEVTLDIAGDTARLTGAGRPLNSGRFFSTPLRLVEGVRLTLAPGAHEACSVVGEWPVL